MRKVKIIAIIALLSSFIVNAQEHPNRPNFDPKEMAAQTVSEFSKEIKISQPIQDSLKVAFIKFFNEMDKDRKSNIRTDMDKIKKMEEARDQKVKSFLTEDQFKTFKKFMEEKQNKRRDPGGEGGMKEPPRR